MSEPITIAFAGNGPVTEANVRELLNDWLGYGPVGNDGYPEETDREINLIFPISKEHLTPAVQEVLLWSEWVDLPYTAVHNTDTNADIKKILAESAENVLATNVNAKVIELLREAEGEKYVVISWGDGSDVAEVILDLAIDAGIKALQLDAGLDELTFDNDADPEEVPPAPEPEPLAAPRTRGRRGAIAPEPLVEADVPLTEADEKPAIKAKREASEFAEKIKEAQAPHRAKAAEAAAAVGDKHAVDQLQHTVNIRAQQEESTSPLPTEPIGYIDFEIKKRLDALDYCERGVAANKLALAVLHQIREGLAQTLVTAPETVTEAAAEEPAPSTPTKSRGRPRKDGSPAQARTGEETTTYINHGDGTYSKKGRGRPAFGEILVDLTDEQAAQVEII